MKGENPVDCIENKKNKKNERRKKNMSKILVLILKVMTGFIFIVAFVEAVKLAVQGIKWLIGSMRLGRLKLKNNMRARKEAYKARRREKELEKERIRYEKMNNETSEATGA
jgi:hypothetical protein